MDGGILATLHTHFTTEISVIYGFVFLTFAGFLFWRSVRRNSTLLDGSRDDEEMDADAQRWGFKSFDVLVLSVIGAVLISRLTYLIVSPDVFQDARWFWIPYEKIEGEVQLFASLPWLFFRVWDAALPHESLILGWLLSLVSVSRILRIPWRFLSNAVSEVFWLCLIGLEGYLAIRWEAWGPVIVVGYLLVLGVFRHRSILARSVRGTTFPDKLISVLWKLSTVTGLPLATLLLNSFYRTFEASEFFIVVSGLSLLVGVWIIAGDLLQFLTILRYGAQAVLSPLPEIASDTSSLSFTSANAGWRRYVKENPVKKTLPSVRPVQRDFSKTYRDYSSGWQRLFMKIFGRLMKQRRENVEKGTVSRSEFDRPS